MLIRQFRLGRVFAYVVLFVVSSFILLLIHKAKEPDDGYVRLENILGSIHGDKRFGGALVKHNLTTDDIFNLPATNPKLIDHIKEMFHHPSQSAYNLTRNDIDDFSRGQSKAVDILLGQKENGYFVDIGAFDGETQSVTLFFEKVRKWRGLLIEPRPDLFNKLMSKNRKVHAINACVRINDTRAETYQEHSTDLTPGVRVPCLWLESLLRAASADVINLLSIDVKGHELSLLKAIPLDKLSVEVISIEFGNEHMEHAPISEYLRKYGYEANHQFVNHVIKKVDVLFVKKGRLHTS